MNCRFIYTIKFVSDMDAAVKFYRDTLGLPLKFQSPEWSEFVTGPTTLALHKASSLNPAGKVQLGFSTPDLDRFYQEMSSLGYKFTQTPIMETCAVYRGRWDGVQYERG